MENFIPDPPNTLHGLATSDDFYEEFESRLENPDERDESGYTLLHAAAWSCQENNRILQLLLERDADVDSTTQNGHTPLHVAVASRQRSAVVALIEAGASVNMRDGLGRTALHFAMSKNSPYPEISVLSPHADMWIVEKLLKHPEIDLNAVNTAGCTPLKWAVLGQNPEAVVALLGKGADPNIPNMWNETPLHAALNSAHPNGSIVRALLSKGVGIYCEDDSGLTPMDFFCHHLPANDVGQHVVWSIVLRYRVRESLVLGLKRNRYLYRYYKRCRREVESMKRQIVYEKFTLHDFACDCFHLRVENPQQDIYIPVVKILLSGRYTKYTDFILRRMTTRDLCGILQTVSGRLWTDRMFENATHLTIFTAIKIFRDKLR